MTFWILLWKIVFVLSTTAFAAMSVWVTIGGYRDIKKLFKKIEQGHHK
ncbi:MAG: hypothetical protein JXB29_09010 [Sedimentisphaerales bacterium]|nr:hypothetical protein [Sedimentisphaerales bacterium]